MTQIYELVTKQDVGVSHSPYVIYTELFLLHKNIQFDVIPLTYSKVGPTIKEVTGGKWDKVPTVKFDNGDIKYDSIPICEYLDEKYPENPIKKQDSKAEAAVLKFQQECGAGPYKLIVLDIDRNLDEASRVYTRKIRQEEFGMSLEEYAGDGNEAENLKDFYQALTNVTPLLENSKYLEGEEAGFSDYVLAGLLQFIRTINPSLYTKMVHNSPYPKISEWATRMDGLFNGYLKNRKTL